MESKDYVPEIDYGEKINTFIAMTENNNQDVALSYLGKYNWDETVKLINKISLITYFYYRKLLLLISKMYKKK